MHQPDNDKPLSGIWSLDLGSGAVAWCANTRRLHDAPDDFPLTLESLLDFYPAPWRARLARAVMRCAARGAPFVIELPLRSLAGRCRTVRIRGHKLYTSNGGASLAGIIETVDSHKTPSEATIKSDILHEILDTMPSGVVVFDENDRYVLHNRAYINIFPSLEPILKPGATLTEILAFGIEAGEYAIEITPCATRAERLRWIADRAAKIRAAEESREVPLGGARWIQSRERRSASGTLVCVRTDITRLKKAEAEARRLAEEDDLTGIPNRRILFERLEACLHRRRKNDQGGAFVLFDLDHFKQLNDLYGHDIGDAVLREIARRATRSIRDGDVVARLGGDEFALILPGLVEENQATRFLKRFLDSLRHPVTIENITIHPSISVGVVFYPTAHQTSIGLYRAADNALYTAKRNGRNVWAFSGEGPAGYL